MSKRDSLKNTEMTAPRKGASSGNSVGASISATSLIMHGHHKGHDEIELDAGDVSEAEQDTRTPVMERWKVICFGQAVSFLYAVGGAIQSSMELQCHWSAPSFLAMLLYSVFACSLVVLYWKRRTIGHQFKHKFLGCIPIEGSVAAYMAISVLDLEAYYFVLQALRYTTLPSVTILGSLAVPSTIFFSRLILGRKYSWLHVLGVSVCMAGTATSVLLDYETVAHASSTQQLRYEHMLLGDLYAILGGISFGLIDVVCEVTIQNFGGNLEYLGMTGFFAAFFGIIQTVWLEKDAVARILFASQLNESCPQSVGFMFLAGFLITNFWSYFLAGEFLLISESSLLSLSTLTENVWSVLFSVLVQGILPPPVFYGALFLTVSGVVIYGTAPAPIIPAPPEIELVDELSNPCSASTLNLFSSNRLEKIQ